MNTNVLAKNYCIQAVQGHYKARYDKKSKPANYQLGDWVLIYVSLMIRRSKGSRENFQDLGMAHTESHKG